MDRPSRDRPAAAGRGLFRFRGGRLELMPALKAAILVMPLLATCAVFVGMVVTGIELNITTMMIMTMIIGIVTEARSSSSPNKRSSLRKGRIPARHWWMRVVTACVPPP